MDNTTTNEAAETTTDGMTARNVARVAQLKSLRYGIELEMVGIDPMTAAEVIKTVVGGDVQRNNSYLGGFIVTMADGRSWKAVRDASLHASRSCEVVSPILTWADMDTVQAITRALRVAGGRADGSCGMHVHVDGAGFKTSPAKVRNLMALAYRWEAVATNIARVLQTRQGYCAKLDTELVDRFRNRMPRTLDDVARAWYGNGRTVGTGHYDSSRYRWINVHALFDKGTIEFRLFNGTVHAGHVKANVLFALGMAACALSSRSVSFRGQVDPTSRTLADGRRAISKHDKRMFLVHVLCLVGEEFKTYRKHLNNFIGEDV
jgi:hypothetical protein